MKIRWINTTVFAASTLVAVSGLAQTAPLIPCPVNSSGPNLTKWQNVAAEKAGEGNYLLVRESIAACFPKVPKCLEAVDSYAEEKLTGKAPSGEPSPLMLKSETDLPPEFLVRDANNKIIPGQVQIPPDIFELAKTKNWKVLDYKTRSTGGFDGSPNLVLVVVPNYPKSNQDIYLQISPAADANHPDNGADPKPDPRSTKGLTFLTVITADKTLNPPVGQLRLLMGENAIYNWSNDLQAQDCARCHTVPLRAISPRGYDFVNWEKPMAAEDQLLTKEINTMMHIQNFSWGRDSEGKALGAASHLQPYGWAPKESPTRAKEYVSKCFDERLLTSNLPIEGEKVPVHTYLGFGDYTVKTVKSNEAALTDWVKIKNSMNCYGCHDGKTRGVLHDDFSFDEIEFKVLIDRSMPPNIELSTDERLALIQCLRKEHNDNALPWQKSGQWMKKVSCGIF